MLSVIFSLSFRRCRHRKSKSSNLSQLSTSPIDLKFGMMVEVTKADIAQKFYL